jgi:transposase
MDEINKIRKRYFDKEESVNSIANSLNRSWETINSIIKTPRDELELRGKRPNRRPQVLTDEVVSLVESYLDQEKALGVKRKQRFTSKKIFNDLKERQLYAGSRRSLYSLVSRLRMERGQAAPKGFLPLEFKPGSTLQVDHGEVDCIIDGKRRTAYLFVCSVPGCGLRFCQLYPVKSQEAWGAFHEEMFTFWAGIFGKVVYDNDSVLVKKVFGAEHLQTNFSLALEEHYGFSSHFCNVSSGHEKGAVENGVGFCRRNFLAGCPSYSSWKDANSFLKKCCESDIQKGHHYKTGEPLESLLTKAQEILHPCLPARTWRKWLDCRVDKYQLITVGKHQYSTPERFVGAQVRVSLSLFIIEIFHADDLVACHARSFEVNGSSFMLDHYLDQLQSKTSALWDCKVVHKHNFAPEFLELWSRLYQRHELKSANREFVNVLLLGRRYSHNELRTGISLALECGAVACDAIENIVRQLTADVSYTNEADLKAKLSHITKAEWSFDLSVYKSLSQEVSHAA